MENKANAMLVSANRFSSAIFLLTSFLNDHRDVTVMRRCARLLWECRGKELLRGFRCENVALKRSVNVLETNCYNYMAAFTM